MLLLHAVFCLLLGSISARSPLAPLGSSFPLHDALGLASSGARTALKILSPVSGRGSACRRDSRVLLTGLLRQRRWALAMLDAQSSLPDGLLYGRWAAFGSPRQCTRVNVELGATGVSVQGRYCLAYVRSDTLRRTAERARSLRALPQLYGVDSAPQLDAFQLGRCVPASCSAEDVEVGLRDALGAEDVKVDVRNCWTSAAVAEELAKTGVGAEEVAGAGSHDWRRLPAAVLVGLCCLALLAAVQGFATMVDAVVRTEGKAEGRATEAVLDALSWLRLVPALGGRASALPAADAVACLALNCLALELTFLSSLLILPYTNVTELHLMLAGPLRLLLADLSGYDALLAIGGLTAGYSLRRRLVAGRPRQLLAVLLGRCIRLLALLGAGLLLLVSVFAIIRDGPVWRQLAQDLVVAPCADPGGWWPVLALLNNYYTPLNHCLGHTWFLAVQAQLWLVSPFLVLLTVRLPRLGTAILVFLTVAAMATLPVITVLAQLPALFTTHDLEINQRLWRLVFTPAHARAAPWLLGLLTGILLHTRRGKPSFLRGKTSLLTSGWTLAIGLPIARKLAPFPFTGPAAPHPPLWFTATFSALAGPSTALSVCWVVTACLLGHGGPAARVLAMPGFRWLRRVSAASYLLLVPGLLARWLSVQQAERWSLELVLTAWLLTLLLVLPLAGVLTVIVTQPLTAIARRLIPIDPDEEESDDFTLTPDFNSRMVAPTRTGEMIQSGPKRGAGCLRFTDSPEARISHRTDNTERAAKDSQLESRRFSLTANLVSSTDDSQHSPVSLRRAMSTLPKRQVSPALLERHLHRYGSVRLEETAPRPLHEKRDRFSDYGRSGLTRHSRDACTDVSTGEDPLYSNDNYLRTSSERWDAEEEWRRTTETRFPLHPRRYLPGASQSDPGGQRGGSNSVLQEDSWRGKRQMTGEWAMNMHRTEREAELKRKTDEFHRY